MGTKGTLGVTYLDLAARLGPDNKIAKIIEMLAQTNQTLEDAVTLEGNLATGHKTTIRTGLPNATWRMLNYGVQPSKSTTTQITDECGMLEAYAEIDKALAALNGNTAEFRLSEDRAFLERMNQEMASALFYGNRNVTPEKFTGLAARYSAGYLDRWLNKDKIGANIIPVVPGAAGVEQTSIWLITWGENTTHLTYPKGSQAGFQHNDLGEQTLSDGAGGQYQGLRTHYKWDLGLVVRDWRYNVRVCNIDLGTITGDTATGNLFDALDDALTMLPNMGMGTPTFYCNGRVEALLRKQLRKAVSGTLTMEQLTENRSVVKFNGVPFKRSDAITNTESPVTFS